MTIITSKITLKKRMKMKMMRWKINPRIMYLSSMHQCIIDLEDPAKIQEIELDLLRKSSIVMETMESLMNLSSM